MKLTTPRPQLDGALGIATAVMLPLGLMVIVLGWYGAAHSPYLWEQVPYLISGGLLGLGLVVGAGLLYLGSWVARGAAAQERASKDMTALLEEIRDELGRRPVASNGSARRTANGNGAAAAAGSFVATAHGSMWHRPDCAVVAGREDLRSVPADDCADDP